MRQSKFAAHLVALEKSGLIVAEYARRAGLQTQALYQARKHASKKRSLSSDHSGSPRFMRLVDSPQSMDRQRVLLEMTGPNQWSLRLEALHPDQVGCILNALGQGLGR